MNEFKFQFVNFLLLGLLVFGMYWAFTNIDNGVTYGVRDLVDDSAELGDTSEDNLDSVFETTDISSESDISYEVPIQESPTLSSDTLVLIEKLEGLISDDIYMKEGSRGTRVGTVQKFLNIYFDTSNAVDNQYGPGTKSTVRKFQSAEKLDADGLAGPSTYKKMIEILKKS